MQLADFLRDRTDMLEVRLRCGLDQPFEPDAVLKPLRLLSGVAVRKEDVHETYRRCTILTPEEYKARTMLHMPPKKNKGGRARGEPGRPR